MMVVDNAVLTRRSKSTIGVRLG
uniref:Uncharacterized protein n=1 Tax=Anguilla anguilla TaxID=7936 RepID=A0A0E9XLH1_ANGAN